MIFSVIGLDEAIHMSNSMPSGTNPMLIHILMNIVTIMTAMARPLRTKARPSLPFFCDVAATATRMAASRPRIQVRVWRTLVSGAYMVLSMIAQAAMSTAAIQPSRTAFREARSWICPRVFKAMNPAPWAQNRMTKSTPPTRANGVNSPQKEVVTSGAVPPPGTSWGPTARPRTKFANPTPSTRDGRKEPMAAIQSKVLRQELDGCLERYSNDTPRTMRPSSTSSSGRYSPENIVAYQPGNAAKVAPPAVSSHTSLPSQVGPMARTMMSRSSSSLPREGRSMATPKSNPSRKKNPIHRTAMRMNHTGVSAE